MESSVSAKIGMSGLIVAYGDGRREAVRHTSVFAPTRAARIAGLANRDGGPSLHRNLFHTLIGEEHPLADADNLLNPPWSYVGNCPPAGTVAIGTGNDCGDDVMHVALGAGTYTLVLTDANYIPFAVFDNGSLAEGFEDLTSGVFQTCDAVSNACITPDSNYAVDILSTQSGLIATPEPSALSLLGIGLAGLAVRKTSTNRRTSPKKKGEAL